jgi:hypothetical protein
MRHIDLMKMVERVDLLMVIGAEEIIVHGTLQPIRIGYSSGRN